MTPADLTVLGLVIQGLALGHGAVQLTYERTRPWWYWLPVVLIVAYYIFALLYAPPSLRHDGPPNPYAWTDASRYFVLVLTFVAVVEGLLWALRGLREQNKALRKEKG